MKNIMKGLKKKSGFTLIEMIVVIGIIGVLAGILIPTFRGYVLSANKANDKVMAKSIYDHVKIVMVKDWDAWNSFYSYDTGKMLVNENGYNESDAWYSSDNGPEGYYAYRMVIKLDGARPLKDDGGYKFIHGSEETKYFAACMNREYGLSTISNKRVNPNFKNGGLKRTYFLFDETNTELGEFYNYKNYPNSEKYKRFLMGMKYTSFETQFINNSSGNIVNRWLVGYRANSPNVIEVWSGNSGGTGASGPRYRVYPNPFEEYTRT